MTDIGYYGLGQRPRPAIDGLHLGTTHLADLILRALRERGNTEAHHYSTFAAVPADLYGADPGDRFRDLEARIAGLRRRVLEVSTWSDTQSAEEQANAAQRWREHIAHQLDAVRNIAGPLHRLRAEVAMLQPAQEDNDPCHAYEIEQVKGIALNLLTEVAERNLAFVNEAQLNHEPPPTLLPPPDYRIWELSQLHNDIRHLEETLAHERDIFQQEIMQLIYYKHLLAGHIPPAAPNSP